jgi:molecular chaperone DnaJ
LSSPHEVLGVAKDASPEQIKKAYRKKAFDSHPDRNPGDKSAEDRFKEVQAAYNSLTGRGSPPQQPPPQPSGFADLFGGVFGFPQTGHPHVSLDLGHSLTLSFWEAVEGGERTVTVKRKATCDGCGGAGALEMEHCKHCGGRGMLVQSQGFVTMSTTCSRCAGTGNQVKVACQGCDGSCLKEHEVSIVVKVPEHMPDGMTIRLGGQGNEYKGQVGSLLVAVSVEPHPVLTRRDDHLFYVLPIAYSQAVLGCAVPVPTLDEDVELTVPPGTKTGTVLRLRGLGFKNVHTRKKGDLLIQVEVETVGLEAGVEYRALVESLAKWDAENPGPGAKSFREMAST